MLSPTKPSASGWADGNSVPKTYTGLLDDAVLRYSEDLKGEDFFRKMIAKNVLFGGKVFINDGYLVNHPVARKYLATDGNILRVMLNQGYVRVLTRAADGEALAEMPVTMAERGIRSYQALVQTTEWEDFQPRFRQIALNVFDTGNARRWPKMDMSYGYAKLMESTRAKTASQLGLSLVNDDDLKFIYERFDRSEPRKGNPRDKFEQAASGVLTDRERYSTQAMQEIMDMANQCYHYNFGLAMMEDLAKEGQKAGISVDTTAGAAFEDYLENRAVIPDQLDNIPLLRLPRDFPFHDGYLFIEFLDPASNIGQAKLRYLHQLNLLLDPAMIAASSAQLQAAKQDVADATDEYAQRISEHITKRHYTSGVGEMLGNPLTVAMGRVRDPVRGLVPPDPVMAIRLLEEAKNYSCDFLVRRFRFQGATKDNEVADGEVIFVKDIKPQIASLAFDSERAKSFISDIPNLT